MPNDGRGNGNRHPELVGCAATSGFFGGKKCLYVVKSVPSRHETAGAHTSKSIPPRGASCQVFVHGSDGILPAEMCARWGWI